MAAWVVPAINAAAAIGSAALGSKGGANAGDQYWKPIRPFIGSTAQTIHDYFAQNSSGWNGWMQGGLQQLADVSGNLQPLINHGLNLMNLGSGASGMVDQLAGSLLNGMPTRDASYNFTAGVPGSSAAAGTAAASKSAYDAALANQIMQGSPVEAAIAAANRDMYRNLTENQLTQIGMNAGAGGNTGSSRRGMSEGIAGRATLDRAADVAGAMYNQAYGLGVDTASKYGMHDASLGTQASIANAANATQASIANANNSNAMNMQNAALQNQMELQTQLQNASEYNKYTMAGKELAGELWGNLAQQGSAYFTPTAQLIGMAPEYLYKAGQIARDAPLEFMNTVLQSQLAAAGGSSAPNTSQNNPWPAAIGQVASAATDWWTNRKKD